MVWFWAAMVCLGTGALGGMFAPWKSGTLSPDSIQRRFYWTGCGLAVVLLFVGQLPNWRTATGIALVVGICVVAVALRFTSHVKIRGRIYAAWPDLRKPDRPPALTRDSDEDL